MSSDEPDFVNEQGIKWWYRGPWACGSIWITELPDGTREYVGVLDGAVVASSTAVDAVAVKLEMLSVAADLS